MSVLNCVFESVSQILRKNVEKKAVFENLVRLALELLIFLRTSQ